MSESVRIGCYSDFRKYPDEWLNHNFRKNDTSKFKLKCFYIVWRVDKNEDVLNTVMVRKIMKKVLSVTEFFVDPKFHVCDNLWNFREKEVSSPCHLLYMYI